jgi:hypothetical protein
VRKASGESSLGYTVIMFRGLATLLWRLTGGPARGRREYEKLASTFKGTFEDVRGVEVSLPRLSPDVPGTCPVAMADIVEHVDTEEMGASSPSSPLEFIRTALIGHTKYWLWKYNDADGNANYALVSEWPGGKTVSMCDWTHDMTPEQFIVAQHFHIGE